MTELSGKDFIEKASADLTALLTKLGENLFGPHVDYPAFGVVTWADIWVMAVFLTGMLLLNGVVVGWLVYQKKQPAAREENGHWRHRLLDAVASPAHLVIWVFGLYLLATPVILRLRAEKEWLPFRRLMDVFVAVGLFVALIWLFLRLTRVFEAWLLTLTRKTKTKLDDLFVPLLGRSLRVIIPVVGVLFALPIIHLPGEYATVVSHASSILIICSVAWILFQAVNFGEKAVLASNDVTVADNLHARRIYTQIHVFGTVLHVIIAIFTVGSILMLFQEVRHVGTSLLASAGVIGVIAGFAAQKPSPMCLPASSSPSPSPSASMTSSSSRDPSGDASRRSPSPLSSCISGTTPAWSSP